VFHPDAVRFFSLSDFFLVGLFPWMAPYQLLIKHGWTELNIFMVFPIIISLGAILVSLLFIAASLFGLNQTLTIDPVSRTITHAYESAIIPLRVKKYATNH
jgi:ABC-type Na+ efflux pump permease subunit